MPETVTGHRIQPKDCFILEYASSRLVVRCTWYLQVESVQNKQVCPAVEISTWHVASWAKLGSDDGEAEPDR